MYLVAGILNRIRNPEFVILNSILASRYQILDSSKMTIPKEVKTILDTFKKEGFTAHIVGGCVRDFLLDIEPKDWDVTTDAKPEEIQRVFPHSFYENKFLTVTVRTGSKNAPVAEVEVTTYRLEAKYSDKRHPDDVRFAKTIEEDLGRRDFTINAIAMDEKKNIVDLFEGEKDLKNKTIRTVGSAEERFSEDALRMLRAVRFATTLGFQIEKKTKEAIIKNSVWIEAISKERIRDELLKIIAADRAAEGIDLLRELELLKYILPELQENYGVGQNKHHMYDCYTHAIKALEFTAKKKLGINVRLAALFHDIGKPRVKAGDGKDSTFYNHEVVGANMTFEILNRLKFPKKDVEKVTKLVRYHLFYYNVGEVSDSSVRRLIRNMTPAASSLDEASLASLRRENMEDLLWVRQADRIGSGVPKAEPYKLRHLKYIIDRVSQDPISAKMIKVNGKDIMGALKIQPGPKVGQILNILLGYVLEDPKKNTKEFLINEVKKLGKLSEKELKKMSEKAQEEKSEIETKQDKMTKEKYWVT